MSYVETHSNIIVLVMFPIISNYVSLGLIKCGWCEPSSSMVNLPFFCSPPLLDLSAGKLGSVLLGLSLCLRTMARLHG